MFAMQETSRARGERLSNGRETCAVPITMREGGRSPHVTTIIELSEHGCAIEGGPILGGHNGTIELILPDSIAARGEFVWSNGKRTGLRFAKPLTGDALDFLLRIAANEDDEADGAQLSRRDKIRQGYAQEPLLKRKRSVGDGQLSSMISREVERSCNHRAEARFPIEYATAPSTIEHGGEALPLFDISSSGLGIKARLGEEIGESLELCFVDCDAIEGRIVWKTADCTGIALEDNAISLTDTADS